MGNLKNWQGPVTADYQERTRQLQHKILDKARALGMTPVLPSFPGFVPDSYGDAVPDADVKQSSGWNGFVSVSYLDPSSSQFATISKSFIEKYCFEFGCNDDAPNYFAADLYNELSPPNNDTEYLNTVSAAVYDAMVAADPNAVWVTQVRTCARERASSGGRV
jgi:alpha-N-acetylglucosaminidase